MYYLHWFRIIVVVSVKQRRGLVFFRDIVIRFKDEKRFPSITHLHDIGHNVVIHLNDNLNFIRANHMR